MKYLIVLGDGMADKNIPELDNRTPLDYADTPAMDKYSNIRNRHGAHRTGRYGTGK